MVMVMSLQYGTFNVIPGHLGIEMSIPEFLGIKNPSGNDKPTLSEA